MEKEGRSMEIFLISATIFILSMIGMSIGVVLKNRPLKGSCGGIGRFKNLSCFFCPKKSSDCNPPDPDA